MGIALFMTVGTGRGTEDSVKSLAHGLLSAIIHYNPDKIVFFGSADSKETVSSLKEQYREEKKKGLADDEFIMVTGVDNFNECFGKMRRKIEECEDHGIIIDYTSGTKTMTMSAAICSMLYHKKLNLISGERGKDGIVIPGTENQREQNLYSAYDELLFDKVRDLFNSYRFEDARSTLNEIVMLEDGETYKKMVDAYGQWDMFNHSAAFETLKDISDSRVSRNKAFLGKLAHNKDLKFFIVDIINNAARRIEEEKYDDAVARLYRLIELIAQARLADMKLIDEGRFKDNMVFAIRLDLLKEKLGDKTVNKYYDGQEGEDMGDDVIKVGLSRSYEILYDLNDELGLKFNGDRHLQNLLQSRNRSILAHGLTPVEKNAAEELFGIVVEYATIVSSDMLSEMAAFPKL
ncbi:MAG: TIGR02710 family CRISPR-associated CARF protein [Euryarchaeota archaeon]|nr:TIGR02710 family CRISPR-associated CARF protein [Euryarchaeota archaeon]